MRNKVAIWGPVQTHNMAQCNECREEWDIFDDPKDYSRMIKHVRQTGHTVVRETAFVSHYTREQTGGRR